MDGHFAHTGEAVDVYDNYMDSVFRHCNGDRVFWIMKYDTILQRTGLDLELSQDERLYDAQSVTADFLTEPYRQCIHRMATELEQTIQFRNVLPLCAALPYRE